jgi:GNAT superfamily N-acetyltransferase
LKRHTKQHEHFKISPVEDFSILAGFSCLSPKDTDRDLDDFAQYDAERHYTDKIAVTYMFEDLHDPEFLLAFATLQNDAIIAKSVDLPELGDFYTYAAYPAVKIGRFGVRLDYQKRHIGSLFLGMLKDLMLDANRTGCRFITVDARRDKNNNINVAPFYEKNGFHLLPCRGKTSHYIPMYFDLMQLV